MRIVVVSSLTSSLVNFRGPLLAAMVKAGHDVMGMGPDSDARAIAQLDALGVSFRRFPLDRRGLKPDRDLNTIRALARLFREIRPDVVLSYTLKPVVYSAVAATVARVPKVASMVTGLGYAFTPGKGAVLFPIAWLLYKLGLSLTNIVFFQNPDDRRLFGTLRLTDPRRAIVTNGSGVDLDHYALAPSPIGDPVFLCVSRLLGGKGVREFAGASMLLKQRHPQVSFRLVGPTEQGVDAISPSELRTWRAGGVEVLGATDDVRPFLHAASVYVLPSYREGTPRSVLEAMSVGRPIITTDVPGCRETVDGHNGLLVPARNIPALVEAMESFLVKPSAIHTMGSASRRLAERKFDVKRVNKTILDALGLT